MTAVIPEIAACTTGRPVSAARICPIATCCAEFADRRYERLFVETTITCAPSRTNGRTWYPKADSKQISVPMRTPRP